MSEYDRSKARVEDAQARVDRLNRLAFEQGTIYNAIVTAHNVALHELELALIEFAILEGKIYLYGCKHCTEYNRQMPAAKIQDIADGTRNVYGQISKTCKKCGKDVKLGWPNTGYWFTMDEWQNALKLIGKSQYALDTIEYMKEHWD